MQAAHDDDDDDICICVCGVIKLYEDKLSIQTYSFRYVHKHIHTGYIFRFESLFLYILYL